MIRRLRVALFCMSGLFTAPVLADAEPYLFQNEQYIDYELPAGEPRVFSNVFRWTIHAECTAIKNEGTNTISIKILRKKGIINDIILHRGESLDVETELGDKFDIVAEPGTSVQMTNQGEKLAIFRCIAISDSKA